MDKFYKLMQEQKWPDIFLLAKEDHRTLMRNQTEWLSICKFLENEFISYISREKDVLVGKLCFEYLKLDLAKYINISESARKTIEGIGKVRTSIPRTKNENFSHLISMGYQ
ncbi:hypothetical protein ACEUBQ_00750 [Aeromonas veronii]